MITHAESALAVDAKPTGLLRRHLVAHRRSRWELFGFALAVACVGFAFSRTSFFFADDFLYGTLFTGSPLDRQLLFRSYFGHLVPGFALLDSLFYRMIGMSWPWAMGIMIGCLVGAAVAVVRLVDAVVGRRRIGLVAGGITGLSLGVLPLVLWWGAAVTNLLPLAAGIGFLGCVTRWARSGRSRHLVAAGLMYALSLSFYEKSLLFSVYAFLWTLLVVEEVPVRTRIRRALGRWPLWAMVAALSMVVVVVYLAGDYRAEAGPRAPAGEMAEFVGRGYFMGLVPSLFGFDLQLPVWAHVVMPIVVVTNVALAGFVIWTTAKSRANVSVWLFFAAAFLVSQLPLAFGRTGLVGVDGGRLLRYQVEGITLMALVGSVALIRALREQATVPRVLEPRRRWPATVAAGAGSVCLAVAWPVSAMATVHANPGSSSRAWVEALHREWPEEGPVNMVDGPMPGTFLFGWQYPYNLASLALPQLVEGAVFTTDPSGAWVIGPDGDIGPLTFAPTVRLTVDGCPPPGTSVAAPLVGAEESTVYFTVEYEADGPGEAHVTGGAGTDLVDASGLDTVYPTRVGEGEFIVMWRGGALDHMSVASTAPGFCVTAIERGDVSAE